MANKLDGRHGDGAQEDDAGGIGMVHDAELLAEAIVDTVREPLLLLDAKLTVKLANRSFCNVFRVRPAETVGRLVYEIGDRQWDVPELRRLLDELLPSNGGFDDFQVEHDFPGVGRRTILLHARKLRRTKTQDNLILLVLNDVTERRRLERQLIDSNENLRQFATVASHDLQAPLRSVSGFADLLVRRYKGQLDSDADEFLAHIVSAAEAMRRLISELLAYARAAVHDGDVHSVASSELLQTAITNLRSSIEESQASIESEALPVIEVDPGQLAQVFQNLIDNAIKYRRPEEPLRVHVSARQENRDWIFMVSDNGLGFDQGAAEKIFEPFRRLHGTDYPGSGIGLAICKRIVEHNGGRIWADSIAGRGSVFSFTIPVSR
ncbi:MAG TPA: ATP-binding protein [Bryobacteraceae bacterium]|nr:ATP-binding protein [Bryobacteraceae bacterium]